MKRIARFWMVFLSTVVIGFGGSVLAQTVGAQAVVALLNIFAPEQVAAIQNQEEFMDDPDALARALLEALVIQDIVPPNVASMMEASITSGVLPRNTFLSFAAEVVNGAESLPSNNPIEAEAVLAVALPQLSVPQGTGGNLGPSDIADTVLEIIETTVPQELGEILRETLSGITPGASEGQGAGS